MRILWRNDVCLVWKQEDQGPSGKCGPDLLYIPPEPKIYHRGKVLQRASLQFFLSIIKKKKKLPNNGELTRVMASSRIG